MEEPIQDRVQLAKVLSKYQPLIQDYAFAIARDFHLAEDVFQEVSLVIAQRWEDLPKGAGLWPWLHETTRHKTLKALHQRNRMPVMLPEETLARVAVHFETEERETRLGRDLPEAIGACVEKLERTSRRVIQERYADERSCEEIAEGIGRSVQSVYSMLKRARLALAQCVERHLALPD